MIGGSSSIFNFEIKVVQSFKDPMWRQINEMVWIKNFQGTLLSGMPHQLWESLPKTKVKGTKRNQIKMLATKLIQFNQHLWTVWSEEGSYGPKAHQKSTKLPTPSSTDNYQTTGNLCEYCDYSFQINYHLRLHISLYHLHHDILRTFNIQQTHRFV